MLNRPALHDTNNLLYMYILLDGRSPTNYSAVFCSMKLWWSEFDCFVRWWWMIAFLLDTRWPFCTRKLFCAHNNILFYDFRFRKKMCQHGCSRTNGMLTFTFVLCFLLPFAAEIVLKLHECQYVFDRLKALPSVCLFSISI